MKQNITVAIDKQILKRARVFAAQQGTSISAMLSAELTRMMEDETAYQRAKTRALANLAAGFHLGGGGVRRREDLHDRASLR